MSVWFLNIPFTPRNCRPSLRLIFGMLSLLTSFHGLASGLNILPVRLTDAEWRPLPPIFPNLVRESTFKTGEKTPKLETGYNCFAWALGNPTVIDPPEYDRNIADQCKAPSHSTDTHALRRC